MDESHGPSERARGLSKSTRFKVKNRDPALRWSNSVNYVEPTPPEEAYISNASNHALRDFSNVYLVRGSLSASIFTSDRSRSISKSHISALPFESDASASKFSQLQELVQFEPTYLEDTSHPSEETSLHVNAK